MDDTATPALLAALTVLGAALIAYSCQIANKNSDAAITGILDDVRINMRMRNMLLYTRFGGYYTLNVAVSAGLAVTYFTIATQSDAHPIQSISMLWGYIWTVGAIAMLTYLVFGLVVSRSMILEDSP